MSKNLDGILESLGKALLESPDGLAAKVHTILPKTATGEIEEA